MGHLSLIGIINIFLKQLEAINHISNINSVLFIFAYNYYNDDTFF